jgi:hypothetical protein
VARDICPSLPQDTKKPAEAGFFYQNMAPGGTSLKVRQ